MSKNVEVLSHEALECLIGIIKQMVTLPKEVIDNLNLSDITTFSSTKIDALLTQTLTDANTHAEELCSTLTKLTCEKTTIQPTLENSSLNIIYLYSADGTAPFQQYLKINTTELIDMGSTDIGLDEYLTITEAVKTYCTITDYETLKNEVVAVKNTIGTETLATTATTLKGAINELESKHYLDVFDLQGVSVLDYAKTFNALTHNYFYANNCADLPNSMNYGYCSVDVSQDPLYRDITFYCPTSGRIYVNTIGADPDDATVFGTWSGWHEFLMKEDIVTTIDSTSTDDTVPTNKAVYENHIHSGKIPHCENIDDVTLDNGLYYITPATTGVLPRTNMYGMLRVECHTSGENIWYYQTLIDVSVENTHVGNSFVWIRINKTNTNTWNGWKRLCYTTVEDIPLTSISSFYTTSVTGTISYEVKNGVCYVNISDVANTSVGMNFPLMLNILPKPKKLTATTCVQGTTGITTGMVYMNVVGELFAHFYVENKGGYGSFSYPVAES